jgi:hypothetical protein
MPLFESYVLKFLSEFADHFQPRMDLERSLAATKLFTKNHE